MRDLRVEFRTEGGVVRAVDGVSFDFERGRTLGIVGESGSGKSVTNLSLLRLVPDPPGRIAGGSIRLAGTDLLGAVRARDATHARQAHRDDLPGSDDVAEPVSCASARQLTEVLELHERCSRVEARRRSIEMLERVGIPDASRRIDDYPHEFSGGMRQRVMIAMALLCKPEVLIADEPTTALDVTIQAQILDLIRDLRDELGTAVILITHDLGVVAGMADDVAVMYAGHIVEHAPTKALFAAPRHPYTLGIDALDPTPRSRRRTPDADPRPAARSGAPGARLPLRTPLQLRPGALWARTSGAAPAARCAPSQRAAFRRLLGRRRRFFDRDPLNAPTSRPGLVLLQKQNRSSTLSLQSRIRPTRHGTRRASVHAAC